MPGANLRWMSVLKTADKRCSEYAEEKNMGNFPPMDPAMCIADCCTGPEHM